MRIGHASISENGNNGRDGKAKAGDQTGKEVCIRTFYKKPWKYLLRCKDRDKAETMANACESMCNNPNIGYDQSNRLTLHNALVKNNYHYTFINSPVETDCSAFMTCCAECAGIFPVYVSGNAPVTANMVNKFQATGAFDVIVDENYINNEKNLLRGDILVGPPNTHTVMVLDNGSNEPKKSTKPVVRRGSKGNYVVELQAALNRSGYKLATDGDFGPATDAAVRDYQKNNNLVVDGVVGPATWSKLGC